MLEVNSSHAWVEIIAQRFDTFDRCILESSIKRRGLESLGRQTTSYFSVFELYLCHFHTAVMQSSFYILFSCAFFTINAAVAMELQPRGIIASLDQSDLPLAARDPQTDTFCDGITCAGSCVPFGYLCCSDGGGGCPASSRCVPNGCCAIGKTCVGGGGTLTLPGGVGPAPTLSDSTPANTAPAGNSAAAPSFNPTTDSSTDGYESFLATAYPSTGSAGGGVGGAGGAAAATSTTGFPKDALSSSTTTSSSSPLVASSAALPSPTPVSGGGSSSGGASSSSGSNNKASSATETVARNTVLSGMVVLVGLLAVQML